MTVTCLLFSGFIFCRAVLSAFCPPEASDQHLPVCLPQLPKSLSLSLSLQSPMSCSLLLPNLQITRRCRLPSLRQHLNRTTKLMKSVIQRCGTQAEDLAAAMSASMGFPIQADTDGAFNQSSQAGFASSAQGQYAPTVPGGQPRLTGMAPQPVPLATGLDIQGYALDEEKTKLGAERGGRAGGWSIDLSKRRALKEAFTSILI